MNSEKVHSPESKVHSQVEYDTPDPLDRKRNGKIARLNRDIREALNRQLKENYNPDDILDWLNALPAVKAVLDKEFEGQPISRQNLAHWRAGGYREWENQRCAYAQLQVRHKEITEKCGNPYQLGYQMAQIHAAEYLATLADVVATAPNAEARMKGLSKAMAEFRGWRRADYHAQNMALQTERLALDKENTQWRREREIQELALKNKKLELDRDKFERTHIEEIVRICKNKTVREIAQDEEKDYTEKIKEIKVIMFGDDDEAKESPESGVPSSDSGKKGGGESTVGPEEPATCYVEPSEGAPAGVAKGGKAHVANQQLASSEAVKISQKIGGPEPGNQAEETEEKGEEKNGSTELMQGGEGAEPATCNFQPATESLAELQPSTKDTQPVADGPMTLEQANKVVDEWYQKARRIGGIVVNSWDVADLRAYLSQEPAAYYSLKTGQDEFRQPPVRDPRFDPASPWSKAWPYLEAEMKANEKN